MFLLVAVSPEVSSWLFPFKSDCPMICLLIYLMPSCLSWAQAQLWLKPQGRGSEVLLMKHRRCHLSAPNGKPGNSNNQKRRATCTESPKHAGQEGTDRRIGRTFERSLYCLLEFQPFFVHKSLPETFELDSVISTVFSICFNEIIFTIFP